jgi:hypothetical protein
MDDKLFKKILIIMVLVIIIGAALYYYFQYKAYKEHLSKLKFPPWPSKCPDYWKVEGDDKCRNIHNIGICKKFNGMKDSDVMDFSQLPAKGKKGQYFKCSWSKKCRAPWEGIDNLCN